MQTVFNLDLNKKNHPTSFAYQLPADTKEMYFRIIENDYVIDYSRLVRLVLRFELENGTVYVQDTSKLSTYQNETVVEYNVLSTLLRNTGELTVTPTVQLSNKTVILPSFKIYLYDESDTCADTNMRNTLTAINYFNYMLSLYYDSIKRDQINRPNGVIGLDSNGDIPLQYFPATFTNHITDKLIDTKTKSFPNDSGVDIGIHGMKLDDKWRLIYYDEMDKRYYVANSIYGGEFGKPNKPSVWNVYGGSWDIPTVSAGTFTSASTGIIDAGSFTTTFASIIDGNNVIDSWTNTGAPIHGGTW